MKNKNCILFEYHVCDCNAASMAHFVLRTKRSKVGNKKHSDSNFQIKVFWFVTII